LRSARLTRTCSPFSSMPRWIGSKIENGNTAVPGIAGSPFLRGEQGRPQTLGLGRCLCRLCVVGAGGLAPGDALAVAGVARPVSVQVEAGGGGGRAAGDAAGGGD